MLNPHDPTVPLTLAEAFSTMGKGIRSGSVRDAVESVLTPLMRTHAESMTLFQKSASLRLPKLQDAWVREKQEPTLSSYITRIGTATVSAGGGSSAEQDQTILELKRSVRSLTDQLEHHVTKNMTDDEKAERKASRAEKKKGMGRGKGSGNSNSGS